MRHRFAFYFTPELGLEGQTFNLSSVEQRGKDEKLNSDCHPNVCLFIFSQKKKNLCLAKRKKKSKLGVGGREYIAAKKVRETLRLR